MTNITNDELIKLSLGFWGEDYAEAPVQQLAKELIAARAEIARLRPANDLIGPWLSSALSDPNSGDAFRRDLEQWFEAQTQWFEAQQLQDVKLIVRLSGEEYAAILDNI